MRKSLIAVRDRTAAVLFAGLFVAVGLLFAPVASADPWYPGGGYGGGGFGYGIGGYGDYGGGYGYGGYGGFGGGVIDMSYNVMNVPFGWCWGDPTPPGITAYQGLIGTVWVRDVPPGFTLSEVNGQLVARR